MLRAALHSPCRYSVHKHKHMLTRIINGMLSREGTTTIYKVRTHIGVKGNELADAAASVAAAAQAADDADAAEDRLHALNPHGTAALVRFDDAAALRPGVASSWLQYPVQQPDAAADGGRTLWVFDELKHQVTKWVVRVWGTAMDTSHAARSLTYTALRGDSEQLAAQPASQYLRADGTAPLPAWLPPAPFGVDPATANLLSLRSDLPWDRVRIGMQVRWRQFFTRARAHQLYPHKHPSPACLHCVAGPPQDETIGHFFGGCNHPLMQDMRCKRHGHSVMHLFKAIRAGRAGACPMYHDSELGGTMARAMPPPIPRLHGHTTPPTLSSCHTLRKSACILTA